MHPRMSGGYTNYPDGVSINVPTRPVVPCYINYACGHLGAVPKAKNGRLPDLAALAGQGCPVCRRRAWKRRR